MLVWAPDFRERVDFCAEACLVWSLLTVLIMLEASFLEEEVCLASKGFDFRSVKLMFVTMVLSSEGAIGVLPFIWSTTLRSFVIVLQAEIMFRFVEEKSS